MAEPVVFYGETFFVHDPGHYALQDFMDAAAGGGDTETPAAMSAITGLIEASLPADVYPKWVAVARRNRATGEEMLALVLGAVTGRPTVRSADSSDGPPNTETNSTDDSSARVISRFEGEGRPDLALLVTQVQAQRAG